MSKSNSLQCDQEKIQLTIHNFARITWQWQLVLAGHPPHLLLHVRAVFDENCVVSRHRCCAVDWESGWQLDMGYPFLFRLGEVKLPRLVCKFLLVSNCFLVATWVSPVLYCTLDARIANECKAYEEGFGIDWVRAWANVRHVVKRKWRRFITQFIISSDEIFIGFRG